MGKGPTLAHSPEEGREATTPCFFRMLSSYEGWILRLTYMLKGENVQNFAPTPPIGFISGY
jgi:hypothetical protein